MNKRSFTRLWLFALVLNASSGCVAMTIARRFQSQGIAETQMPLARLNALKFGFRIIVSVGAGWFCIDHLVTNLKKQTVLISKKNMIRKIIIEGSDVPIIKPPTPCSSL